jgi:hypothetical protein
VGNGAVDGFAGDESVRYRREHGRRR